MSPRQTLAGLERIRARGVDVSYTLIPGALHGVALRAPWGSLVPLPRADHWVELVSTELAAFRQPA